MKTNTKTILAILAIAMVLMPSAFAEGFEDAIRSKMISAEKSCYVYTKDSAIVNDGATMRDIFSANEEYKIYPMHDKLTLNELLTKNKVSFEKAIIKGKNVIVIVDLGKAEKTGKEVKADKNSVEAQACYAVLPYSRGYHSGAKAPEDPLKGVENSETSLERARRIGVDMILGKRLPDARFDVDRDGAVTGLDLIRIMNSGLDDKKAADIILLKIPSHPRMDVDGDGAVTGLDMIAMKNIAQVK